MKDWAAEARQAWLRKMGARKGLLDSSFEYISSARTNIRRHFSGEGDHTLSSVKTMKRRGSAGHA